jgi:uncharacterized Zn finger protein
MMQEWLRTLDDDAIADWANKGLLKRGAKALAAVDAGQWELAANQARAGIEGHVQTLAGAGFATLQCSCPAFGPCHHLCALLLGLRARLTNRPGILCLGAAIAFLASSDASYCTGTALVADGGFVVG